MKKLSVMLCTVRFNSSVIKSYLLGLSAVFLVSATKAAATKKCDLSKVSNFKTATPRAAFSALITVNLSVTPANPMMVSFTPVGGGETLSFLCFGPNTTSAIPTGVYNVKFTIPASGNPFHQIEIGGNLTWITPFPDLPTVSGGEINGLSVSSAITVNVS